MEEEESIGNIKNCPSSTPCKTTKFPSPCKTTKCPTCTPCASEVKSSKVVKSSVVKSSEVKSSVVKSSEVKSSEVKSSEVKAGVVKKEIKLDNSASQGLRPKPHSTNQPKWERQRIVRPPPRSPVLKQSACPPHPSYYPQHILSSHVPQYKVLPLPHNHLVLLKHPWLLQHTSHSPWYTDDKYRKDGFIYHQ